MGYSDVNREAFLLPVLRSQQSTYPALSASSQRQAGLKDPELPGIQSSSDRQCARLPLPEVTPPQLNHRPPVPPSPTTHSLHRPTPSRVSAPLCPAPRYLSPLSPPVPLGAPPPLSLHVPSPPSHPSERPRTPSTPSTAAPFV
ncbi:unnamed protein product [Boreogadus saida]